MVFQQSFKQVFFLHFLIEARKQSRFASVNHLVVQLRAFHLLQIKDGNQGLGHDAIDNAGEEDGDDCDIVEEILIWSGVVNYHGVGHSSAKSANNDKDLPSPVDPLPVYLEMINDTGQEEGHHHPSDVDGDKDTDGLHPNFAERDVMKKLEAEEEEEKSLAYKSKPMDQILRLHFGFIGNVPEGVSFLG